MAEGLVSQFLRVFHNFNQFLSTAEGDFFKTSIELIVLLIISYMIFSEFSREKNRQLRFLSIAFSIMAVDKFIKIVFLLLGIYLDVWYSFIGTPLGILLSVLEIAALILIANAFTFDHRKRAVFFASVKAEIFVLLLIFTSLILFWHMNFFFFDKSITNLTIFIVLELIKVGVLGFAAFLVLFRMQEEKYKTTVVLAFFIYIIAPFLDLIRFTVMPTQVLKVLSHPFPLLAMLLFARAVFLKFVDKQTLKQQISMTRLKYRQEKVLGKMKDEFISTVSHELKTPLTSIRLYLSLLLQEKQGQLNPDQKKTIGIISDESRRLTELISDLLQLSKLENTKQELRLSKQSLKSLVESAVHLNLAEKKQITVNNRIQDSISVIVDANKLKQVIINLYGNAVKYTDEGGTITLDAKQGRDCWIFSISDNGIGISKDKQKQIFSKFYQVENYMTRRKGGTGLGLSIAKHIVDLHSGRIKVSSELGKGSTFSVIIPNDIPPSARN